MFLREILSNHFHSVAIIGMAKNTGKTYTFNQLVTEGQRLGIKMALTSLGLDGEERDSIQFHKKPSIKVYPGVVVANAKVLLLESQLDYEVMATTGVYTPLGEVVLARVLSAGTMVLAGPGSAQHLASVKQRLGSMDIDLLLVDGAADRRSLSVPLITDTAVLAVGAEVAWDRLQLLDRLRHFLQVLTLPGLDDAEAEKVFQAATEDVKLVGLAEDGQISRVTRDEFLSRGAVLSESQQPGLKVVYVRGMLTDAVLAKVLGSAARPASFTLVASDPTAVFLSRGSLARLASQGVELCVLRPLHLSAVTVSPFHSRYGHADPIGLLEDVGRTVHPIPCFDLRLGLRYRPAKEEIDAVP